MGAGKGKTGGAQRAGKEETWGGLLDQGPVGTGALRGVQGFSIIFGPV